MKKQEKIKKSQDIDGLMEQLAEGGSKGCLFFTAVLLLIVVAAFFYSIFGWIL